MKYQAKNNKVSLLQYVYFGSVIKFNNINYLVCSILRLNLQTATDMHAKSQVLLVNLTNGICAELPFDTEVEIVEEA